MIPLLICKFETCDNEFKPHTGKQIYCHSERCRENRNNARHKIRRDKARAARLALKEKDKSAVVKRISIEEGFQRVEAYGLPW